MYPQSGGSLPAPHLYTGLCKEAPCPPKTPRDPLASSLESQGCLIGLVGALKAKPLRVPTTLGGFRVFWGSHLWSPRDLGRAAALRAVFFGEEASGRARSSADWLLCYYPETRAGAERTGS